LAQKTIRHENRTQKKPRTMPGLSIFKRVQTTGFAAGDDNRTDSVGASIGIELPRPELVHLKHPPSSGKA